MGIMTNSKDPDKMLHNVFFFFVALHPKSTAMVMAGGSVRWAL